MTMFAVYPNVPDEKIREAADKLLKDIPEWFSNNPKRRVCRVEFFYGKVLKLTRKNYKEMIEQTVKHPR